VTFRSKQFYQIFVQKLTQKTKLEATTYWKLLYSRS